jgi:hypothetical protein
VTQYAGGLRRYTSYLRQPWLTAEQITVDPGKIYQGYVPSSDDQWMTVLLYQSRTIAYSGPIA